MSSTYTNEGAGIMRPVSDEEYTRNMLSSAAAWFESRSCTVWASDFEHKSLMLQYAAFLREHLQTLPTEGYKALRKQIEDLHAGRTPPHWAYEDISTGEVWLGEFVNDEYEWLWDPPKKPAPANEFLASMQRMIQSYANMHCYKLETRNVSLENWRELLRLAEIGATREPNATHVCPSCSWDNSEKCGNCGEKLPYKTAAVAAADIVADAERYRFVCSLTSIGWARLANVPDNEIDALVDAMRKPEVVCSCDRDPDMCYVHYADSLPVGASSNTGPVAGREKPYGEPASAADAKADRLAVSNNRTDAPAVLSGCAVRGADL